MADARSSDRDRSPLLELTRVRVLEFVREPEAVFWVFVFPVLLAFALGIAFRSTPADDARAALVGPAPAVAMLTERLGSAPGVRFVPMDAAAAAEALRKGRVDVVVEVNSTEPPDLVLRSDEQRAEGRAARLAADDAVQRALGRRDVAAARAAPVREPGTRYIDFLIPGLVGLNLMGSGMWGLGFAIVVARTRKLLKRFAATPMRRSDFLLSFMVSRLLFLVPEVAAIVGFGALVFGVRVAGGVHALAVVALAGAACFAGIGLLVAARPRTIEAVSGWMNLVMLPMWLLSGTFFSYERFPEATHAAIRLLPLTALNDALRAVMNDGATLAATAPELAVLLAWGGVSFVLCLRLFRWQ
jgi:ABC-type multidrug transport system permease subunit